MVATEDDIKKTYYAPDGSVLEQQDKRVAAYRPAEDLETTCGSCEWFRASGEFGGSCIVVAGLVRPDYVCDYWTVDDDDTFPDEEGDQSNGEPLTMRFEKVDTDDEMQIVFGWANVAVTKDGEIVIDRHGESILPGDLEKSAYEFVLNFRETGDMHEGEEAKGHLVESMMFTPEKLPHLAKMLPIQTSKGFEKKAPFSLWWVGFHIEDEKEWAMAKSGERPMFSIQGWAEPVEVS